jgi:hypothetical protein
MLSEECVCASSRCGVGPTPINLIDIAAGAVVSSSRFALICGLHVILSPGKNPNRKEKALPVQLESAETEDLRIHIPHWMPLEYHDTIF